MVFLTFSILAISKHSKRQNLFLKIIEKKLEELKLELIKANVAANKTNAKTKEIKRAIARIITINKSRKEELKKKV